MPMCPQCRSEDTNIFRDIQSNILKSIICRIKVGHKCSRIGSLDAFTIAELRRHVESGECPGYSLKCFCDSLEKFTLEGLKKHLREDCE